ncbi:S8 family serine peptidase [Patescibacteria group bacterium]|nr:S8 family serine peptidase [Patescibacteria group bacterium]
MQIFFNKKIIIILSLLLISGVCFDFLLTNEESVYFDEVLVKLRNNSKIYKINNIMGLSLDDIEEIITKPPIEWIEPNYYFHSSYLPSDKLYNKQWYLDKIKAPQSWDFVKGGRQDIIVAVLDTGVDIYHPDLKDNIWINQGETKNDKIDNDNNGFIDDINGWDFIQNIPDPSPKFNESYDESGIHHGTLVAGIIAAKGDNFEGITGVSWNSKIMPLRVLSSEGTGSVNNVIKAVDYAVDNGVNIINLSFVGTNKSYFLKQSLKNAWNKGVIIVAAAGNETAGSAVNLNQSPNYPICLDKGDSENFIIGVAAVDNGDRKTSFSDYGSDCVDISAPGASIYGTLVYSSNHENFDEYYGGYWSGTSIAAPIVSGLFSLVFSINPLFSHKQVQDFVLSQADEIDSFNPKFLGQLGSGRVNAYKTLKYAYEQLGGIESPYYIVTGAGPGGGPHVRVFDSAGLPITGFFAYHKNFRGGVNVVSGDINGDNKEEIITGAGPGGGPHVRVFDLYGSPITGFFAYNKDFLGGINVAAGDINGDGRDEIIVVPEKGGEPNIKVFDGYGKLKHEFLAYNKNFSGGVSIYSSDVDNDGMDEIITGAGPGGGPHVRVFDGYGNLKYHFFAYNKNFYGGINITTGDISGDNRDEIIVSIDSGASPYIRVFGTEFLLLKQQFLGYDKDFYQGSNIVSADFDEDSVNEIILAPNAYSEPQVRIFNSFGKQVSQFYAYSRNFKGGVNIATIKSAGY